MISKQQMGILGGLVLILVIGAGYFVYADRPVVALKNDLAQNSDSQVAPVDNSNTGQSNDANSATENENENENEDDNENGSDDETTTTPTDTSAQPNTGANGELTFTMADVQSHGSDSSCYSAINSSVYDLTEWISRHPGGAESIKKICGKDGSELFNKKHGTFTKAIDALALLKIGALK